MRLLVGLLSDTHDDEVRATQALAVLRSRNVEAVLHAGDLSTDLLLPAFGPEPTWIAQGNTDDEPAIRRALSSRPTPVAYAEAHEIELDRLRIGLLHGDDGDRLEAMIEAGGFDLVVHGHTHRFRDVQVGATRVVNPGAVHLTSIPSVCTFDTAPRRLERIVLVDRQ